MTDSRDNELSRIYREGAWPEPSRQLDEAILEASRRARAARRSKSLVWRFGPPFALAATVVLASSLLLRMNQEMPGEKIAAPAARRAPPAPRIVRPVEEPKPVAEAVTSNPESTPPGLVQAPPPAASALALKKEAPPAARADQIQRQPDLQQRLREASQPRGQFQTGATRAPAQAYTPALTTPVVPATGSSAASGAGVSGPLAGRSAPVERSPETWLEDIRKLKAQGRSEEAQRELAEFRKRYADYRLPDDLR